jgi:hypothetical protein
VPSYCKVKKEHTTDSIFATASAAAFALGLSFRKNSSQNESSLYWNYEEEAAALVLMVIECISLICSLKEEVTILCCVTIFFPYSRQVQDSISRGKDRVASWYQKHCTFDIDSIGGSTTARHILYIHNTCPKIIFECLRQSNAKKYGDAISDILDDLCGRGRHRRESSRTQESQSPQTQHFTPTQLYSAV